MAGRTTPPLVYGVPMDGAPPLAALGPSAFKAVRNMRGRQLRIGRLAAGAAAAAMTAGFALQAMAADTLGQPTDGAIDFQPAATDLRQRAMDFHTWLLLP